MKELSDESILTFLIGFEIRKILKFLATERGIRDIYKVEGQAWQGVMERRGKLDLMYMRGSESNRLKKFGIQRYFTFNHRNNFGGMFYEKMCA
jgi:hypothetical protein